MDLQSPRPATTIRRNPPRKAKQTSVTHDLSSTNPSNTRAAPGITPFPLGELLETNLPQITPLPDQKPRKSNGDPSNNIKVFLRIRPIECNGTQGSNTARGETKAPSRGKFLKGIERKWSTCLSVNSSSSVTLNAPPSALDSKRAKSEIYDGFSHVFPPESLQEDIYDKVMKPVVNDFLEGQSSLLVGMGPTGSGKTYTMFGSLQQLGIVPIALRQIFSQKTLYENTRTSRTYYLSMFEIHSERGKGEKIFDLSPESTDNTHPHTSILNVKEVKIITVADAENIVTHGILKRSTAPTNANNQSSRSQCIVNVRCVVKNDTKDSSTSNAILTIADLAGAERERKTGNQGARLLESNFINNTSMIFGLCLRSLLEHQKNPKKPVEKHFKNSLLTRYLQDYMEGKKRMTLILTVKAADEDYMETSYILRQTSPYMKIKFNHLDENKNAPCRKRNAAVVRTERSKRRKIQSSDASLGSSDVRSLVCKDSSVPQTEGSSRTDVNHVMMDTAPTSQISKRDSTGEDCIEKHCIADFNVELQKFKRSEEVMRNFARAFWSMLKQYKHKLKETENEVRVLKDRLREQNTHTTELEKVLTDSRNSCSCLHNLTVGECAKVLPYNPAISMTPISSNTNLSLDNDVHDEYHTLMVAEISGETIMDRDAIALDTSLFNTEISGGLHKLSLPVHQGTVQQLQKTENELRFLKDSLIEHNTQATELEKELNESRSSSSCLNSPPVEECDKVVSLNHAIYVPPISLNPDMSHDNDALSVKCHTLMNAETSGEAEIDLGATMSIHQGALQQEEVSLDTCSSLPFEEAKELNYQFLVENSESYQKVAHNEMVVGKMDAAVMNFSEVPTLSVELEGDGCFSILPGIEETLVVQVEESAETSGEAEMDLGATMSVHQGALQQEEVSLFTCSSLPFEEAKELNYQCSDENSESYRKVAHNEMVVGKMDAAVMNFSEVPNLTVELEGDGCVSLLPGNEKTSVVQVEEEQLIVKVVVSEKAQQITKSHPTEALCNEDGDPALRTLNSERPKRKLLPASQMLLKDFSGLVVDENAKEMKRKKADSFEGRSQDSNSLIRILKSNLPR